MLIKLISDFKPEHAVVVLDHGSKNFRHELYKEYKSNRPPAPDDLAEQLKIVKTAAEALNFKCLTKAGFEADDIIATLAIKATSIEKEAIIISADKDLMQLVNHHIKMYDPTKSKYIKDEDIIAKFGVPAGKVREVQALMGDKSDNIPGIPGIGPKTASLLIKEYDSLEGVINNIDKLTPRHQKLVKAHSQEALLSWQLVGLDCNVDIDQDIENFHWNAPSPQKISDFLTEHGFKSLHKRIESLFQLKIQQAALESVRTTNEHVELEPIIISDVLQLDTFIKQAKKSGIIAVLMHKNESCCTISLADGNALYQIDYPSNSAAAGDLFSYSRFKPDDQEIIAMIHSLFSDKSIKKITYNLKELLRSVSCPLNSFEDLMLMDYVLTAGNKAKELLDILENNLAIIAEDYPIIHFVDCYNHLFSELIKYKVLYLYDSIDLSLCHILHDMENIGIKINPSYLLNLSLELKSKIDNIEKRIFTIAGKEFNIASPKQLGIILFDELKLPYGKASGKSKSYSTNVDTLEKLHADGYEIAQLLLDYRHLSKLKNTYTDTLPKQADPQTHRIHTTFLQCITTTGRLSSINPNIQNIPIRSEEGNKIRAAFIASENCKLISADYSQIELRILSHVADIATLKKAFQEKKDIHAQTASQIFDVPLQEITPETRRKAKAINFGIIYGISAFGLAKQLGISRDKATEYINRYFKEYPGIKQYMNQTIEFARKNGFVENLLGRKCFIPTINSKDYTLRSFGERAAINAPMQSLASDIVKIAMIELNKAFIDKGLKTKMILQIHDELIFEAPNDEVAIVLPLVQSIMESAYLLNDVGLNCQVNAGLNWQEIH
jgi:DNA polymerase-1